MTGKVLTEYAQFIQLLPGFLFFPFIIRQVYQIIKAGIFNMLKVQDHFVEPAEKPPISSVSFSIQSKGLGKEW